MTRKNEITKNDNYGRERKVSILLDAPLKLVWEAWTNPSHIKHWWGPEGFTNTIEKMEVHNGGEWVFTMHGPDGKEYPNNTIFREVVRYKKLVHEHFDPNFMAIIEFEEQGNKTILKWHKIYETKELFDIVEKQYKAGEGLRQTINKLQTYLQHSQ